MFRSIGVCLTAVSEHYLATSKQVGIVRCDTDPLPCHFVVAGVALDANEPAPRVDAGDSGSPTAHGVVEHRLPFLRVSAD